MGPLIFTTSEDMYNLIVGLATMNQRTPSFTMQMTAWRCDEHPHCNRVPEPAEVLCRWHCGRRRQGLKRNPATGADAKCNY